MQTQHLGIRYTTTLIPCVSTGPGLPPRPCVSTRSGLPSVNTGSAQILYFQSVRLVWGLVWVWDTTPYWYRVWSATRSWTDAGCGSETRSYSDTGTRIESAHSGGVLPWLSQTAGDSGTRSRHRALGPTRGSRCWTTLQPTGRDQTPRPSQVYPQQAGREDDVWISETIHVVATSTAHLELLSLNVLPVPTACELRPWYWRATWQRSHDRAAAPPPAVHLRYT